MATLALPHMRRDHPVSSLMVVDWGWLAVHRIVPCKKAKVLKTPGRWTFFDTALAQKLTEYKRAYLRNFAFRNTSLPMFASSLAKWNWSSPINYAVWVVRATGYNELSHYAVYLRVSDLNLKQKNFLWSSPLFHT